MTAALPRLGKRLGGRIEEAVLREDAIAIRMPGRPALTNWGSPRFSGGEADCLFYELAIAIADMQGEVEPTLLIFDNVLQRTDVRTAQHLLGLLSAPNRTFQSVVLDMAHILPESLHGWSLSILTRTATGTQLRELESTV
ncbi:hypothetical protein ACWCPQ_34830 [Nocardia sp. NPDC001965]